MRLGETGHGNGQLAAGGVIGEDEGEPLAFAATQEIDDLVGGDRLAFDAEGGDHLNLRGGLVALVDDIDGDQELSAGTRRGPRWPSTP